MEGVHCAGGVLQEEVPLLFEPRPPFLQNLPRYSNLPSIVTKDVEICHDALLESSQPELLLLNGHVELRILINTERLEIYTRDVVPTEQTAVVIGSEVPASIAEDDELVCIGPQATPEPGA